MATYKPEQMLSFLRRFPEDRFAAQHRQHGPDRLRQDIPGRVQR
jgi:hypothetical protein